MYFFFLSNKPRCLSSTFSVKSARRLHYLYLIQLHNATINLVVEFSTAGTRIFMKILSNLTIILISNRERVLNYTSFFSLFFLFKFTNSNCINHLFIFTR